MSWCMQLTCGGWPALPWGGWDLPLPSAAPLWGRTPLGKGGSTRETRSLVATGRGGGWRQTVLLLGSGLQPSLQPGSQSPQRSALLRPQPAARAEMLSNVRALLASSRQQFPALWHEPGGLACRSSRCAAGREQWVRAGAGSLSSLGKTVLGKAQSSKPRGN